MSPFYEKKEHFSQEPNKTIFLIHFHGRFYKFIHVLKYWFAKCLHIKSTDCNAVG